MKKPFYRSKTFWFNMVTIMVTVASFMGYVPNQELAEQVTVGLVSISPLINLGLRFITKSEITLR